MEVHAPMSRENGSMRSERSGGVRRHRGSPFAIVGVGALLVLAVFGAALRGPWVIEPRSYDFAFPPATPPALPERTPDVADGPLLPPAGVADPLDLRWVIAVLTVVALSAVAFLLWRLWLRYREPLPETDAPRGAGIVDSADAVPDIPVLLRGVEAARQSLRSIADPSDAVIAAWLSLEDAAAESGVVRHPASTPTEFTVAMLAATGAARDATAELLTLYELARFSTHAVTAVEVDRASRCLGEIAASWHASARREPS
jgi:hypothetical protein